MAIRFTACILLPNNNRYPTCLKPLIRHVVAQSFGSNKYDYDSHFILKDLEFSTIARGWSGVYEKNFLNKRTAEIAKKIFESKSFNDGGYEMKGKLRIVESMWRKRK